MSGSVVELGLKAESAPTLMKQERDASGVTSGKSPAEMSNHELAGAIDPHAQSRNIFFADVEPLREAARRLRATGHALLSARHISEKR